MPTMNWLIEGYVAEIRLPSLEIMGTLYGHSSWGLSPFSMQKVVGRTRKFRWGLVAEM